MFHWLRDSRGVGKSAAERIATCSPRSVKNSCIGHLRRERDVRTSRHYDIYIYIWKEKERVFPSPTGNSREDDASRTERAEGRARSTIITRDDPRSRVIIKLNPRREDVRKMRSSARERKGGDRKIERKTERENNETFVMKRRVSQRAKGH